MSAVTLDRSQSRVPATTEELNIVVDALVETMEKFEILMDALGAFLDADVAALLNQQRQGERYVRDRAEKVAAGKFGQRALDEFIADMKRKQTPAPAVPSDAHRDTTRPAREALYRELQATGRDGGFK